MRIHLKLGYISNSGTQVQARNEFRAVTDVVFIQPTFHGVKLINHLLPPWVQDHEGKHIREMCFDLSRYGLESEMNAISAEVAACYI